MWVHVTGPRKWTDLAIVFGRTINNFTKIDIKSQTLEDFSGTATTHTHTHTHTTHTQFYVILRRSPWDGNFYAHWPKGMVDDPTGVFITSQNNRLHFSQHLSRGRCSFQNPDPSIDVSIHHRVVIQQHRGRSWWTETSILIGSYEDNMESRSQWKPWK